MSNPYDLTEEMQALANRKRHLTSQIISLQNERSDVHEELEAEILAIAPFKVDDVVLARYFLPGERGSDLATRPPRLAKIVGVHIHFDHYDPVYALRYSISWAKKTGGWSVGDIGHCEILEVAR